MRAPSLLALLLLAACAAPLAGPGSDAHLLAPERPLPRRGGERLPTWSGSDPQTAGWVRFDDRVWERTSAAGGKELRTPNVVIEMPVPVGVAAGRAVAHLAQAHVQFLFSHFGSALDLRLPESPLRVVLHARRATTFVDALDAAAPGHPGWGAFYDARRGVVQVCAEPAPQGALPLEADLRHEMTHQILDLSTASVGRGRILQGHYLWLWEGFAAWTEGLGDRPGEDTRRVRRQRYQARRARRETVNLPTLFRTGQDHFDGRRYDQSAVLLEFLMSDGVEGGRRAVLATLRDLLRGRARDGDFERGIGLDAVALDRRWRHTQGTAE